MQKVKYLLVLVMSIFSFSCQKSSYCDILDHEGPDYTTCRTPTRGSCKPTSGCGLFWLFECDGMCLGLGI